MSTSPLRLVARTLARQPLFAYSAILSLALAIALNTTMFSVLDAMVNPRIDIADPGQLYSLRPYANWRVVPGHTAVVDALADGRGKVHDGVTSYSPGTFFGSMVEYRGRMREASTRIVAANYFEVLGVRPLRGRLLDKADFDAASRVAVISDRFARQLMPDRESPLGAQLLIEGEPYAIVGVLTRTADLPGDLTDLWVLPATTAAARSLVSHLIRMRGVAPESAHEHALELFARRLTSTLGGTADDLRLDLRPAMQFQFRFRGFHIALGASVLAVLLVACANLANMQLARGLARTRELAVRVAVGASRAALVRHLMLESALLVGAGLGVGLLLTWWGMFLVRATVPPSVATFFLEPQTSWRVFGGAALVSCLALFVVGLLPALRVSRVDPDALLKSGAGTGRHVQARSRYGLLVAVEIALALAVASSAALLSRAALQSESVDYGLDVRPIVTGFVRIDASAVSTKSTLRDRANEIVIRLSSTPGLDNVVVTRGESYEQHQLTVDDPGGATVEHPMWLSSYTIATPEYFRTLHVPIVRGRDFRVGERDEGVAIVSESMARRLWPNSDPVGRRIKLGARATRRPWIRVVGVSRSVRFDNGGPSGSERLARNQASPVVVLNAADSAIVSTSRQYGIPVRVYARSGGSPERLAVDLRARLATLTWLDARLVRPLESFLGITAVREGQRFIAAVFTVFAAFATALAALGVYSVVSYAVERRRRELGVRLALGAGRLRVLALVLRETNLLALCGIAVGLVLSALGAHLLSAYLWFEDDVYDSIFFAGVAMLIFAIATGAALLPARRASAISPVEAMKAD